MLERFVARALRGRWMVLVIGTLTVALVLPSGGSAQGRRPSLQTQPPFELLTTGAVKQKDGFKLALEGANRSLVDAPNGRAQVGQGPEAVAGFKPAASAQIQSGFLAGELFKRSGKGVGQVSQYTSYGFRSGITFKSGANLKSAKITGTFVGRRGQVRLTFAATEPAKSVPLPKGCTGRAGMRREGTLKGKFVLKADKLGKQRLSSVGATLERPPKIKTCQPGGASRGVSLFGSDSGPNSAVYTGASKGRGKRPAEEFVEEARSGTAFSFDYQVSVNVPRSHYTYPADLSGAQVNGYGPMKGSASYSGSPESGGQSQGALSGDLSARNAAIGEIRPFSGGALSAIQTQH
jgi:hypothetical protein